MAKPRRLIFATVVVLLTLLSSGLSSGVSAATSTDEVKWTKGDIPSDGQTGQWVLARGSDLRALIRAADGTLYSYANPSGTTYTLFKSDDGGHSWSHTGKVTDAIIDIAVLPDDANHVYYATTSNVYRSIDAGASFTAFPTSPGGAGSNNVTITSLDVVRRQGNNIVAVSTRDSDSGQYGGAYLLDESAPLSGWQNANLGNRDAYAVLFSPDFAADRQMFAVSSNESDTFISARTIEGGWSTVIGEAAIRSVVPASVTVTFPDDFNTATDEFVLFAGVNSNSNLGDVYRVNLVRKPGSSLATDLNVGSSYDLAAIDIGGLAVSGNSIKATLLAGTAGNNQVYISHDGGKNWVRSSKKPSGQSITGILMAPDFARPHNASVITTGADSAFSYTGDDGVTWNQRSLIDARIGANGIIGLSPSPDYSQDETLFLLTFDDVQIRHSLWRSQDGGANWERVLTSAVAEADTINRAELSPQYSAGNQTLYVAGTVSGQSILWKSTDNGQTFSRRGVPFSIDAWTLADDNTLFFGSYNGTSGLVYQSNDGGFSYSTGEPAGDQPLKSLVLSPAFRQDKTVLVGSTYGWVYLSTDNGTSFELLGQQLPGNTEVSVAFDPKFTQNKTVYAISSAKVTSSSKERIFRFIKGKSDTWESTASTLPVNAILNQLTVSEDGTLYTSNSQAASVTKQEGGMLRSLDPTHSLGPTFETVLRGLDDGVTLTGLWIRGSRLWSIDTKNTRVMTYQDTLATPVMPVAPPDKAPGINNASTVLDWKTLDGATNYHWQLNYASSFTTVPADFEGDTESSSTPLPTLRLGTTYYWRVRATEPVSSRWSATQSFTTNLGAVVAGPELYSPKAGAESIQIKPVFQWSAYEGAEGYELLVSANTSFDNPLIARTGNALLPINAWQSDVPLDYASTYFWKVRAVNRNSSSVWSAVGAFTTVSQAISTTVITPAPIPPQTPTPTSSFSPSASALILPKETTPSFPQWVLYLFGTLLLAIVLLLAIILVMVVRNRRP